MMCPEPTALNFVVKCGNLFFPMTVLLRSNDPIFTACQRSCGKVMFSVMSVCQSCHVCVSTGLADHTCFLMNKFEHVLGGEGDLGPVQMEGRYLICRKGEGAEALYKGQLASYRMLSYNHIIGGSLQIDLRLGISDSFLGIFFGN